MWGYRVLDGLWSVVPVALAWLATRPVSDRELRRFAARYGLDDSPPTTAVAPYVRRGRLARLGGAALGLSLHPLLYAAGLAIPNDDLYYGVLAYLLGAFVTALVPLARPAGTRRASLVPRRATDYLPRTAFVVPPATVALCALAVVVCQIEPRRYSLVYGSATGLLVLTAVAVAATLAGIRAVVARSQPVADPVLVAVDDAIRSQAAHTLSGAGTAIALLGAAGALLQMGAYASPAWLHVAGLVAGLAAAAGAVVAWCSIGSAWRVVHTSEP